SPESDEIAVIKEYHEAMNKAGKSPSYNSLEGYLGMKFFSQALKAAGKDLNRDSLVKALNSQSFKVGSENISWSAKSHSGLKKVFLTKIKGNKAVPVNKLND
ncbi:MAG: ABC transporter substrate-binding protein, partial [Bdellovibrionota bacterium]|nr:ABC transporter substrate-binding protein [Bdellovibrionota bacterium]